MEEKIVIFENYIKGNFYMHDGIYFQHCIENGKPVTKTAYGDDVIDAFFGIPVTPEEIKEKLKKEREDLDKVENWLEKSLKK